MTHQFVVEGIDVNLASVTLRVLAASALDARAVAQQRGVQPVQVWRDWGAEFKARLMARSFPVAVFFRELALLMRAGLTLSASLTSLREKEKKPALAQVLDGVLDAVGRGGSFTEALARYPEFFSPVARSAIEAAEGAGALADVLDRLAQHLEQGEDLRRRVVGALLYPALVVVVGALVTAYLMLFVVPRFAEVYRDLGPAMPWVARWLVVWAGLLAAHAAWVYAALLAPVLALASALAHPSGRERVLAVVLRLPAVQARYALFQTVQFYRGLVMLLASGATLPRSLATLQGGAPSGFGRQIAQARGAIESGVAVSDALYASGLATAVSVRLIAAGEQSGSMVQSMTRVAQMQEADLSRDVEWLLKVLEPLLMLAVGLVVGGVVVLLYLPIFELASVLG